MNRIVSSPSHTRMNLSQLGEHSYLPISSSFSSDYGKLFPQPKFVSSQLESTAILPNARTIILPCSDTRRAVLLQIDVAGIAAAQVALELPERGAWMEYPLVLYPVGHWSLHRQAI